MDKTPAPQQAPKEYIITEEQLLDLVACSGDGFQRIMLSNTAKVIEKEIRSRPHPAPMPNDYRELFIRDLLYNFRWTAEHGNPEFFKAVEMIKREYLKPESQLLAAHDAAIARQARDVGLDAGISLIQKRIDGIFEAYRGEENENLTARPFAAADGMDEAIKMLKTLRSTQPSEQEG